MLLTGSCATSLIQTLAAATSALSARPAVSVNVTDSSGSKQRRRRLQEHISGLGQRRQCGQEMLALLQTSSHINSASLSVK